MEKVKCEILAKITKRDYSSLVGLVCCIDGKCIIVPKEKISNYEYTNAVIGFNGNLYLEKNIREPVNEIYVDEHKIVGASRDVVVNLLNRWKYLP